MTGDTDRPAPALPGQSMTTGRPAIRYYSTRNVALAAYPLLCDPFATIDGDDYLPRALDVV